MRVRDTKPKLSRHVAIVLALCWGCADSLTDDLDGRPCTDDGRCVAGYVCSLDKICVREGSGEADSGRSLDRGTTRISVAKPEARKPAGTEMPSGTAADGGTKAPDPHDADAPAPGPAAEPQQPATAGSAGMSPPPPRPAAEPQQPATPASAGMSAPAPRPPIEPQQPATAGSASTNACASGTRCGEKCVDTLTDAKNCGGCDKHCRAKEQCSQGSCKENDPKDDGSGKGKKEDD